MRLLVIGGGGREHALVWKLNQSPLVSKVYAVPGNGGISEIAECFPDLPLDATLVTWAEGKQVDLVVIGPEAPLVAGLADDFEAAGLKVFGPGREAARLEGSKSYAKEIMTAAGVSTAAAAVFTDYQRAVDYISGRPAPYVIKADGLAAGKGVIIAEDFEAARQALETCLVSSGFGEAGSRVVIEEFLEGQEVSVLAFVDGKTVKTMPPAQDYKRVGDGDSGPNTGGMGAYAPAPFFKARDLQEVVEKVIGPTISELAARGTSYKGVLYVGLMLTPLGPKVLEFNTRFGDPETEVIMPLLKSDLAEVMLACCEGRLDQVPLEWSSEKCLTVVLASEGYPDAPVTGRPVTGLDAVSDPEVAVFHAGTRVVDGRLVSSSGRVLAVTALGETFARARERAYKACQAIEFEGRQFRRDIGESVGN